MTLPLQRTPGNIYINLILPETNGEEMVIVGRTVWTQCTSVTDRRARTDGQIYN